MEIPEDQGEDASYWGTFVKGGQISQMCYNGGIQKGRRSPMRKCPKCGNTIIQKNYDEDASCIMCGFTYVAIAQDVKQEVLASMGKPKVSSDLFRGWRQDGSGLKL